MLMYIIDSGPLCGLAFEVVPVFFMGPCGRPGIMWYEQHPGKVLMDITVSKG